MSFGSALREHLVQIYIAVHLKNTQTNFWKCNASKKSYFRYILLENVDIWPRIKTFLAYSVIHRNYWRSLVGQHLVVNNKQIILYLLTQKLSNSGVLGALKSSYLTRWLIETKQHMCGHLAVPKRRVTLLVDTWKLNYLCVLSLR